MKIAAIIQARLGSKRFPRKVLAQLAGRTVIERVVTQVGRMTMIDLVVVAAPNSADAAFIRNSLAEVRSGLPVIVTHAHHPEYDVLGRYVEVATDRKIDIVVRITADCPLLDPEVSDRVVRLALERWDADLATNVWSRTFPKGFDTEVIKTETLCRIDRLLSPDNPAREHVTLALYDGVKHGLGTWHPVVVNVYADPVQHPEGVNLCVDYPEDIARLEAYMNERGIP